MATGSSRGARDHDLEPHACKPLKVGSVERQDSLRTPFACAGGDQSVIARGAGDLALAEIFDELPSFLPVKPNEGRPLPQGTFQDRESILDTEPMRTGQSSHDRVGFDSLPTLADLSENLVDRRLGERWSFLGGYRNPEGTSLDNRNLAGKRLDLDLSFLDRNPQRHPGKDPSLVTDRFGEDKPAGRVDGRLNGISHGAQNTMTDRGPG